MENGMNGYAGAGGGFTMENSNGGGGAGGDQENGVTGETQSEGPKYSDINMILDQILTMSDQNIDEAQVGQSGKVSKINNGIFH